MSRREEIRGLMEAVRDCHAQHRAHWERVRASELDKRGVDRDQTRWKISDDELWKKVWAANGVAYRSAMSHADERNQYLGRLAQILPGAEQLRAADAAAIDLLLDFLEIRVPAFRC